MMMIKLNNDKDNDGDDDDAYRAKLLDSEVTIYL